MIWYFTLNGQATINQSHHFNKQQNFMKLENLTLQTIKQITVGMVILLIAMTLIAVYYYPENIGKYGLTSFIWTISLLIIYLIFCIRIPAMGLKTNFSVALQEGAKVGTLAGVLWIVHVTIEYFVFIPKGINGSITLGFMGILFIAFGVSAYRTMNRTQHIAASLLSGVWCAMLSILVLFVYGFIINFLFMKHLISILQFDEEFKMSRMPIASYTIHNTLESGGTHLLIAPIIAVIFSLLGIAILKIQRLLFKYKPYQT